RLRSRVSLRFDEGAVIEAADPRRHDGSYDPFEPVSDPRYQDFGHSTWRNSLICGVGVDDVVIEGPGLIDGRGLTRGGPGASWARASGERPASMAGMSAAEIARLEPDEAAMQGLGDKAIALRDAHNIRLSGLTVANGGHIAVLATSGSDLVLEDLTIDT